MLTKKSDTPPNHSLHSSPTLQSTIETHTTMESPSRESTDDSETATSTPAHGRATTRKPNLSGKKQRASSIVFNSPTFAPIHRRTNSGASSTTSSPKEPADGSDTMNHTPAPACPTSTATKTTSTQKPRASSSASNTSVVTVIHQANHSDVPSIIVSPPKKRASSTASLALANLPPPLSGYNHYVPPKEPHYVNFEVPNFSSSEYVPTSVPGASNIETDKWTQIRNPTHAHQSYSNSRKGTPLLGQIVIDISAVIADADGFIQDTAIAKKAVSASPHPILRHKRKVSKNLNRSSSPAKAIADADVEMAAIGVWFGEGHTRYGNSHNIARQIETKKYGPMNLLKAHLYAALQALEIYVKLHNEKRKGRDKLIFIRTDCNDLVKCVTKNIPKWQSSNFSGAEEMRKLCTALDKQIQIMLAKGQSIWWWHRPTIKLNPTIDDLYHANLLAYMSIDKALEPDMFENFRTRYRVRQKKMLEQWEKTYLGSLPKGRIYLNPLPYYHIFNDVELLMSYKGVDGKVIGWADVDNVNGVFLEVIAVGKVSFQLGVKKEEDDKNALLRVRNERANDEHESAKKVSFDVDDLPDEKKLWELQGVHVCPEAIFSCLSEQALERAGYVVEFLSAKKALIKDGDGEVLAVLMRRETQIWYHIVSLDDDLEAVVNREEDFCEACKGSVNDGSDKS